MLPPVRCQLDARDKEVDRRWTRRWTPRRSFSNLPQSGKNWPMLRAPKLIGPLGTAWRGDGVTARKPTEATAWHYMPLWSRDEGSRAYVHLGTKTRRLRYHQTRTPPPIRHRSRDRPHEDRRTPKAPP